MIKAVIFDLDGVIVDTAKYHFLAWSKLSSHLGLHFDEDINELLKGVSRGDSFSIILRENKKILTTDEQQYWCTQKNEWYKDYLKVLTPYDILPGILDALQWLKDNNIRIALGSASKNSPVILDKLNISHFFDVVIDGNAVSAAKPNPQVFLKAATFLKVYPENCIVIEDAKAGIEAAKRAKMRVVGIGSDKILNTADIILPKTDKIKEALLQLL